MPHPPKSKAQSEEEDFSDVSSGSESSEDEDEEDNWVFPVVGQNAKHTDYVKVRE